MGQNSYEAYLILQMNLFNLFEVLSTRHKYHELLSMINEKHNALCLAIYKKYQNLKRSYKKLDEIISFHIPYMAQTNPH